MYVTGLGIWLKSGGPCTQRWCISFVNMPPACGGPLGSRKTTRHPTPVFTTQTLCKAFPFIR